MTVNRPRINDFITFQSYNILFSIPATPTLVTQSRVKILLRHPLKKKKLSKRREIQKKKNKVITFALRVFGNILTRCV